MITTCTLHVHSRFFILSNFLTYQHWQTHVTIIEGSYAMHPLLRKYYDYMIYLTIDPQTQQNRIYERNPEKYDDFVNRWIPLEERYFTAYCFEKICNICIKAEEW